MSTKLIIAFQIDLAQSEEKYILEDKVHLQIVNWRL